MPAARSSGDPREEAPFVFDGEVVELGGSTAPEFTGAGRTAVARITRVVSATPVLVHTVGMLVTIELASRERVQAGKIYEFSTQPRLFADSIVVTSVGHADVGTTARLDVPVDPVELRARRGVRAHVADADLIVTGRVTAVRLVPRLEQEPVSEHDPRYREAVIEVSEVEKGKLPAGELVALFAASNDPAWRRAPKLEVGQEGVFLLHAISRQEASGSVARFACLHEADVQPMSRLNEIRERV